MKALCCTQIQMCAFLAIKDALFKRLWYDQARF